MGGMCGRVGSAFESQWHFAEAALQGSSLGMAAWGGGRGCIGHHCAQ